MWFSHVTGPLGPRVRTYYVFVMDYVSRCSSPSEDLKALKSRYLGLSSVDDLMKLSYIDPDAVDVIKTSGEDYSALVVSYY